MNSYKPALKFEVEPALPLHDPTKPWLKVKYINGEQRNVDLTTLLKDAHLIQDLELDNSTSTVALLRILISIIYENYQKAHMNTVTEWDNNRASLIQENQGFPVQWVDEYFSKWHDRFYLIHPNTPFLQDPSLYESYASKPITETDDNKLRKNFYKSLTSISNLYPKQPSTANEDGQKVIWGIPEDEIYDVTSSYDNKINWLLTSLLHHRYTHSATNRGERTYYNKNNGNDAYHAVHAFRCAIQYVPEGTNLYQTLLLAVKFSDPELRNKDIPEWERNINSETGFLEKIGYDVNYLDLIASLDSPRSSVNMTHLSLIFVPEVDNENHQKVDGGQVHQMRRVLFNFKHYLGPDDKKLPFPVTWNPFVALKVKDGKALKQVSGLSDLTAMGSSNLYKIPLLPNIPDIQTPEVLRTLNSRKLARVLPHDKRKVKVYVYAGDPSKDKTYSDFVFVEKSMVVEPEDQEKVENWFSAGTDLKYWLNRNLEEVLGNSDSLNETISTLFWNAYTPLFNDSLQTENIKSIQNYKEEILNIIRNIYNQQTSAYLASNPLKYAKNLGLLMYKTNSIFEGKI
jgi:hypothetical protein